MPSAFSPLRSPSPPQEGDIAQALSLANDQPGNSRHHKGKQKALQPQLPNEVDEDDTPTSQTITPYPPTAHEDEETRRVEETLKRWELVERQRRRAARDSSQSISMTPSLVENVTRRASALWSTGKKSKTTSGVGLGLGTHTALQSEDRIDILPMGDINVSPTPSPSPSPTRSETNITSPFADPVQPVSPFADVYRVDAAQDGPLHPLTATSPHRSALLTPSSPTSSLHSHQPPPPQPLGLPAPRTPPPIPNPTYPSMPPRTPPKLHNKTMTM
ncbi:hypothetical protein BDQ17DRAFT_1367985 [Cyathus striatus]|nr:hypothetical protein BDQ17DRAFT_1367985 [Cyathus striatus]